MSDTENSYSYTHYINRDPPGAVEALTKIHQSKDKKARATFASDLVYKHNPAPLPRVAEAGMPELVIDILLHTHHHVYGYSNIRS